jgi:hypothetical protein
MAGRSAVDVGARNSISDATPDVDKGLRVMNGRVHRFAYSITWSARASRLGGTVIPRAFAVLVDYEFEFLRLLDRQITWIGSFQNVVDICCR